MKYKSKIEGNENVILTFNEKNIDVIILTDVKLDELLWAKIS